MSTTDEDSVGVSVAWSWQGVSANIKSRFLSAVDRLGGRRIDENGLGSERRISAHRALTDARVLMIEAATRAVTKDIESNPELARRALQLFSRADRQAENIDACLDLTVEDLLNRDHSWKQTSGDPERIEDHVIDRWEHYAGQATSDQLRERWGRVLAAEIRSPGTFSLKCMRIVDEIDAEVAHLFELLCTQRVLNWVPECNSPINHNDVDRLIEAGLLVQTELGRTVSFSRVTSKRNLWIMGFGSFGIGVTANACFPAGNRIEKLDLGENGLALPVHVLSEAGVALASIMPDPGTVPALRLAQAMARVSEKDAVLFYRLDGDRWIKIPLPDSIDEAPVSN